MRLVVKPVIHAVLKLLAIIGIVFHKFSMHKVAEKKEAADKKESDKEMLG